MHNHPDVISGIFPREQDRSQPFHNQSSAEQSSRCHLRPYLIPAQLRKKGIASYTDIETMTKGPVKPEDKFGRWRSMSPIWERPRPPTFILSNLAFSFHFPQAL